LRSPIRTTTGDRGDGGWRNDPHGNGQNASTLLGALLRVDVDHVPAGEAYGIPADNEQRAGWAPEVFAIGLRNPWRYTFDDDGRLVVADVGQDRYEEVSIARAGDNLGWNVREAAQCFEPKRNCPREGLVDPVWEYGRALGQSITGGHVYGGELVPGLVGRYVVADFLSGNLWALALPAQATGKADAQLLGRFAVLISAFGKNATGEIFALDFGAGRLLRIEGG
jgi:glucose/arabinose dehydrogenase